MDVSKLNTDSEKTNFKKVANFNKIFNSERVEKYDREIIKKNPKLVEFRLSLIREEVKELEEAVVANDMTEVIDALADILYVVYGAGDCLGINLDKVFQIVHSSNMTKLCKTEDEAIKTVEWYKKHKLDIYPEPDYKKSNDDLYWIVYNKSTGKILKSINYLPVKLTNDDIE